MSTTSGFRAPTWQTVGAVASVLALVISLIALDFSTPRLIVTRILSLPVGAFVPSEVFAIVRRGSTEEVTSVMADYVLILNDSRRAVQRETFKQPITIRATSGQILASIPCPEGSTFDGLHIGEISLSAQVIPKISNDAVLVDVELLNRGEVACVIVFTVQSNTDPEFQDRLSVAARLVDIDFVYHKSSDHILNPQYRKLLDFFSVSIHLRGLNVYLFLGLQLLFFSLATLLAYRAQFLAGSQVARVARLSFLVLVATAAAQVLIAMRDLGLQLHVASWPALAVYAVLVGYLAWRAWKTTAAQPPSEF